MAKQKTKSKKQKLSKKKWALILIGGALILFFAVNTINSHIEFQQKQNRLESSAVILDDINNQLKSLLLNTTVERSSDCKREETKLSSGWILCSQILSVNGRVSNPEEHKEAMQAISEVLDSIDKFNNIPVDQMTDFERSIEFNTYLIHPESQSLPPCLLHHKAYPVDYRVPADQGKLELTISCTETDMRSAIY